MRKFIGHNSHRLDDSLNFAEQEYVLAINKELNQNGNFLAQICKSREKYPALTEAEEKIALSVIQWLGTNVGQGFIDKVQKAIDVKRAELTETLIKKP